MHRIGLAIALMVAPCLWSAALAQAPTVSGWLDSMFLFVFKLDSCEISPTQEQAEALAEVAGPLQRKANLSNDDMDKAFARATSNLETPDCSAFKASVQSEIDRLLAMAKQVL